MSLPRLAVLISGSGSNLQALLDACAQGRLEARVAVVVSDRPQAYGLERARRAGVPVRVLGWEEAGRQGLTRAAYDAALAREVAAFRPDLVVLAGWMRILGREFLEAFPGRVINLHPALPGAFPGARAIARAYQAYRRGEIHGSGCMVHLATEEVDAGPVLGQMAVPLYPEDTLEAFEERMHQAEHGLLVQTVGDFLKTLGASTGDG